MSQAENQPSQPGWTHASDEVFRFPASFSQRALWVIHDLDPDNLAYHLSFAFRVRGPFSIDTFRDAVNRVVAEHESLRAVFVDADGEVMQEVLAEVELQIPCWQPVDPESFDQALLAAVRRKMDLRQGPLFTAEVLRDPDSYVVLLRFHHIIVDQLSIATVVEDLSAAYSQLASGAQVEFVPSEIDYVDYVVWQAEEKTREKLQDRLQIWTSRIQPGAGCNGIPTDRPRPASQSFSGNAAFLTLGADQVTRVRAYARTQRTSVFNVLLSAFALLLNRYSRDEQLLIGVPFANRGEDDTLERVVGLFINTLPVPCEVDGKQSFSELVGQTAEIMREIQGNQDVPLEYLMDALKPARDPSFNPLFQIGFSVQQSDPAPEFDGLQVEIVPVHNGSSMYDLHLFCWDDQGDTISLQLWYDDVLFDASTMNSLLRRFEQMIGQCLANPDLPVASHSITSADELALLKSWNDSARRSFPVTDPLALMEFESGSVHCDGQSLEAAALSDRASRIAARLKAQDIGPGNLVGVLMERSCDLLAALLGIWKAGAGYVPLDPRYPADWRTYVMSDAGLSSVIADNALENQVDTERYRVVSIDDLDGESPLTEAVVAAADDIAYVIYTSGSTGQPKGVMVPRSAVANFLQAMAEAPGLGADDCFVAVTTTAFDISVLELFLPLAVGATLHIATADQAGEPNRLKDLLAESGATAMQATPSTWRMLVNANWEPDRQFCILTGGEALQEDLAASLLERSDEIWNLYGPTETTVWSTSYRLQPQQPVSIGQPIANTRIHVVDEAGRPVPIGVVGDLLIGGDGVTLGYRGKPDLTATAFVETTLDGGRVYRTGDLARWMPDGQLRYLGRSDHQVKIRGHRIEMGQIEATLAQLDSVEQVVVHPVEAGLGDQRLVAYFIPRSPAPRATELRKHLRKALPDYMIPNLFVPVTEFPLTDNGKVNRRLLPKPSMDSGPRTTTALTTETEKSLAQIWSRIVGTPKVGADDNFFEIGGHSLLAVSAASEIERTLGVRLNLRVFVLEKLSDIARLIEEANPPSELPPQAPGSPVQESTAGTESDDDAGHDADSPGWLKRLFR